MISEPQFWYENVTIWAGLSAWFIAQFIKLFIHFVRTHKYDPAFMFRLGGMPSSHSAAVSAVATSIGIICGFGSSLFAVSLALAAIVMIDAQSVRRAAGQQARVVNQIVDELFKTHRFPQHKLGEFLGHTRVEVLLGMVLGIVTALLAHSFVP
jgi:acid phosphatase family membrane protein YuiD